MFMMNEEESITVQRIEELMAAKRMNAAAITRAGGVDKGTLSNILNGRRKTPSPKTLEQIAHALGTSLDYLWGNTDDPRPRNGEALPAHALDVIEAMRQLPAAKNHDLAVMARSLAEAHAQKEQAAPERDLPVVDSVVAEKNQRAFAAMLTVIHRRHGPAAAADLAATLCREFPDLAAAAMAVDCEHDAVRVG